MEGEKTEIGGQKSKEVETNPSESLRSEELLDPKRVRSQLELSTRLLSEMVEASIVYPPEEFSTRLTDTFREILEVYGDSFPELREELDDLQTLISKSIMRGREMLELLANEGHDVFLYALAGKPYAPPSKIEKFWKRLIGRIKEPSDLKAEMMGHVLVVTVRRSAFVSLEKLTEGKISRSVLGVSGCTLDGLCFVIVSGDQDSKEQDSKKGVLLHELTHQEHYALRIFRSSLMSLFEDSIRNLEPPFSLKEMAKKVYELTKNSRDENERREVIEMFKEFRSRMVDLQLLDLQGEVLAFCIMFWDDPEGMAGKVAEHIINRSYLGRIRDIEVGSRLYNEFIVEFRDKMNKAILLFQEVARFYGYGEKSGQDFDAALMSVFTLMPFPLTMWERVLESLKSGSIER